MIDLRNRKAPRATWRNYCNAAAYFMTIFTKGRQHYFGQISDGVMHLSDVGIVANDLWFKIKNHFPGIDLDAFVVMPNHIHGIIIIPDTVGAGHALTGLDRTRHALSLPGPSLSTVVGTYKSAVTKRCNEWALPNGWQTRFHDRIIRDVYEFDGIATYIENYPQQWQDDRFYGYIGTISQ